MLEDMKQVDWEKLGALQFPVWIRELASIELERRLSAYDSLFNALVPWAVTDPGMYWGSLVEPIQQDAFPLVIPFLIELLEEATVSDKVRILWLLHEIASYADIPCLVPEESRDMYMKHALKLLKAVSAGRDTYSKLSNADTDEETQSFAQDLLQLLEKLGKLLRVQPPVKPECEQFP